MAADTNYSPTPPILYIISMKCNPLQTSQKLKKTCIYILPTSSMCWPLIGPSWDLTLTTEQRWQWLVKALTARYKLILRQANPLVLCTTIGDNPKKTYKKWLNTPKRIYYKPIPKMVPKPSTDPAKLQPTCPNNSAQKTNPSCPLGQLHTTFCTHISSANPSPTRSLIIWKNSTVDLYDAVSLGDQVRGWAVICELGLIGRSPGCAMGQKAWNNGHVSSLLTIGIQQDWSVCDEHKPTCNGE